MLKKIDFKKCRWLILVVAVIAALIAAAVRSGAEVPEGAHANAWITAGGRTASSGLAPNGEPFDIYRIRDIAVLGKAIEKSGLAGRISAEELAANLAVRPASSGGLVSQLRSFESQTTYSPTRTVKTEEYHSSVWQIQLYGRIIYRDRQFVGNVVAEGRDSAVVVRPAPFAEQIREPVYIYRRSGFLGIREEQFFSGKLGLTVQRTCKPAAQ